MKVRKFRILRLRHHVSMVELETIQKIQNGFERILTERMEDAERLHLEYQRCRNALMQRVGEDEYEL